MPKGPEGYPGESENNDGEEDNKESFADKLKKNIESFEKKGKQVFDICLKQSEDYQRVFELNPDQIQALQRAQEAGSSKKKYPTLEDKFNKAQIKLKVENEEFAIISEKACCHDYGKFSASEGWKDLFIVIAKNPELNISEGGGTSWINVVPEEWHRKIITTLTGKEPIDFDEITPEDIIGTE